MATIQIRNVPDEVHHTYARRAAAAGQSLQEYLRAELIENASLRSPAEVVGEVEERMRHEGRVGYATVSSVDAVRSDHRSH